MRNHVHFDAFHVLYLSFAVFATAHVLRLGSAYLEGKGVTPAGYVKGFFSLPSA